MLIPGAHLGPYEIQTPLGSGGMGEVYKARDTRLDRNVAIKVLPPELATDPHRRERFKREARAISSLAHPHICTLHDVGEHNGVDFLVMEHLSGETLAQRLLRGPLPLDDVLRTGAQLADALDAAHRHGVIHRDLKPSNVMLTPSGAKILDFGLAKSLGTDADPAISAAGATLQPTLTQVGTVVGTIQYMAPEQVEGKPVDARSDLFALGAILYELTTGRKAFEGTTPASVMGAILNVTPTPIATLAPMTPPALDRLVRKCLAKDPAKRWQTAADLRDELIWIGDDARARMSAESAGGRPRRPKRVATWALAIAAVSVGAFGAFVLNRNKGDAPASMRFTILPPPDATDADIPIVSPNGQRVAFVARVGDKSSLFVRAFDSLDSRVIADADPLAFPFWSADSRSIAFFGHGHLNRVSADGGPVQVICDAPSGRGGAWNRDGIIVFAPSLEAGLNRIPAGGGTPTPATSLDKATIERSHRFPQFLEDGRHFIYTVYFSGANQTPKIQVSSLDSPAVTNLVNSSYSRAWAPPGYLVFPQERTGLYVAQPFDHRSQRLHGEPAPLVDRVAPGAVGGDSALSVSNAGVLTYEAMTGEQAVELRWFGRNGQTLGAIGPVGDYRDCALSPDGRHVAVVRRDPLTRTQDIWVIDVNRGSTSRLTSDGTADDPVWFPEGDRVAFSSNRLGTGNNSLYVASVNNSGDVQPLVVTKENKFLWDISHDARFVLFAKAEGSTGVGNFWILPLPGGHPPWQYLESEFQKGTAHFSPNTRWVAYEVDESWPEVYVESFPERHARSQVSTNGGAQPRWRRDGKELFYLGPDTQIMSVQVKTEGAFEANDPKPLFHLPASTVADVVTRYDVDLNGQRFLIGDVVRPASRSPIVVVLNWIEAVKK